jgi:hypothetical protein
VSRRAQARPMPLEVPVTMTARESDVVMVGSV